MKLLNDGDGMMPTDADTEAYAAAARAASVSRRVVEVEVEGRDIADGKGYTNLHIEYCSDDGTT